MSKKIKFVALITALLSLTSALFFGCSNKAEPDYSDIKLSECVKLGEYKNMTLKKSDASVSDDIFLWNTVVEKAEILKYPNQPIEYYKNKTNEKYDSLAKDGGMSRAELLDSLGISESDIEAEAKKYVKDDLVRLAVLDAEGIEITDEEKEKFFDKYVYRYTELYGYTQEYVRKNLTDEIYESMLYDKMMEYLLLNNEIISAEE